ncbi:MAG: 50S ribosomal protein L6 [Spirochaetota bacterium]
MSRVGKQIINVPDGVTIQVTNNVVTINGKLGSDTVQLLSDIEIKIEDNKLTVIKKGDEKDKKLSAAHGLLRALINNMIAGVSKGFKKELEIVGVGYRAAQQNKNIELSLGFSHSIVFTPPSDVTVKVLEPTKLEITGIDRQKVGQVAANIRKLRPPEPYKGKGVRYKNEYVKRKAGKAGKA